MNLLNEPWMPVRLHNGSRTWISPVQLSDPEVAAFDANRPDFNGALAQFAIGLLQTTAPVQTAAEWRALLKQAPDAATLAAWFEPHRAAFELDAPGARFMQDFELRPVTVEPLEIGSLLIETPGENTLKNNSDHFIKRNQVSKLCHHCVALALFTLQTNAPSGGAGHRTGLRGGGPLTTLLVSSPKPGEHVPLWRQLWLNVQERAAFERLSGDSKHKEVHATFPWMASITAIQPEGGQTAPVQVHPAHVFWAMPRRIRLDFDAVCAGHCDVCGRESDRLVQRYVTRNYGLNYKGAWRHPLSPYYESKEDLLPVHPQPGGLGYRHWLAWVLGVRSARRKVEVAAVVQHFLDDPSLRRAGEGLRLWAFGFDMDNMKARCWYEATMPLYELGDCPASTHKTLREDVGAWLDGAELVAGMLRGAVKDAWFSADARGDFSFIDASFWSATEPAFYQLLKQRIDALRASSPQDDVALSEGWLKTLQAAAHALFDQHLVGTGVIERQNPKRTAQAYHRLRRDLWGKKLREALRLPVLEPPLPKAKPVSVPAA